MGKPTIELGKISFESFHRPGVQSGRYELNPTLAIKGGITDNFSLSQPLVFEVAGPRFALAPNEIESVFPPRDSLGEFDNILPSIELTRSTLPWERDAGKKNIPWLGLILLQEVEFNDPALVKVTEEDWPVFRDRIMGPDQEEIGDKPSQGEEEQAKVKALWLEPDFFDEIILTATDLDWLSHVRVSHDQDGNEMEKAVLVCNRLPKPGARARVHLVSFENRFDTDGNFNKEKGREGDKIPLLSILSWEFACPASEDFKVTEKALDKMPKELKDKLKNVYNTELKRDILYRGKAAFLKGLADEGVSALTDPDKGKLLSVCHIRTETFKGLINDLDLDWMKISLAAKNESADKFFNMGSVPLAHGLKTGVKVPSWYRGPLVASKKPIINENIAPDKRKLKLPARNASQLLLLSRQTGMLDTSYAAAWELGRLISVSHPGISQQIAHWKTSHAREVALAEQNLVFSHIPFNDANFAHEEDGQLNQNLKDYFTDLSLLKQVPFQYLVPHKDLLPDESMRFFYVDPFWVESLLDGAFSIGRTTELDTRRDDHRKAPTKNERPLMTGVLLRSDLVSGWPSIMLKGFGKDESALPIKRFDRLGPGVLLVLFEGVVKTTSLHLPAESLHFGFNRPFDAHASYFKELKDENGKENGKIENIAWKNERRRVFDPLTFANEAKSKIGGTINPGILAMELIEGVQELKVRVGDI